MSSYELVLVINPEVADEDVPGAAEKVSELIAKVGGSVTEITQWGRKRLAYPIRRFKEGSYVLTRFEIEPALTKELDMKLRSPEEILRHLLIKLRD